MNAPVFLRFFARHGKTLVFELLTRQTADVVLRDVLQNLGGIRLPAGDHFIKFTGFVKSNLPALDADFSPKAR